MTQAKTTKTVKAAKATTKTNAKATETVNDLAHTSADVARKIWLAGVGAYGKMFDQAQDQLGKVTGAAQEVFEQLVEQGEKVEDLVKAKIAQNPSVAKATIAATEFTHKATDQVKEYRETRLADIEGRLEGLRHTIVEKVQPFNIFAIGQKIEELTASVASLQADVAGLKGEKAPKAKAEKAA